MLKSNLRHMKKDNPKPSRKQPSQATYTPEEIVDYNIENISNSAVAASYYDWQISGFVPYIKGKRVLEIGAGIGTISQRLVKHAHALTVTDLAPKCLDIVKDALGAHPGCNVDYALYTLGEPVPAAFKKAPFEAAVCINVLEHIEQDLAALQHLRPALVDQGKLLLLVPAIPALYGSVDEAVGHYRRYTKKTLSRLLEGAGFKVRYIRSINILGTFGWWVNAKLLKRKVIPMSNFRVFKYLAPIIRAVESVVKLPIGISIIAVAEKSSGGQSTGTELQNRRP